LSIATDKLWIPAVCLSFVVSACSSDSDSPLAGVADVLGGTTTDGVLAGETITDETATGGNAPDESTTDGSGTGGTVPDGTTAGAGTGQDQDVATDEDEDLIGAPSEETVSGGTSIASIQGSWSTGCISEDALFVVGFSQTDLVISDNSIFTDTKNFTDQDCTEPQEFGFGLSGSSLQQSGVLVPTGEIVTTSLGPSLAIDIFIDMLTIDNQPIPAEFVDVFGDGDTFFEIVLVDGDMLFFGDSTITGFDGESPETRPVSLDFEIPFFRVP